MGIGCASAPAQHCSPRRSTVEGGHYGRRRSPRRAPPLPTRHLPMQQTAHATIPVSREMLVEPCVLEGTHVRLEPLSLDHLDALTAVGLDPDLWQWTLARN